MRTTSLANFVRNSASSSALSPPPTTATFASRKKKPSQVAQAETPRPRIALSLSRPSHMADAPVARMSASAVYVVPDAVTRNGRSDRSTASTSVSMTRLPNRMACSRIRAISAGPSMPSGKPG